MSNIAWVGAYAGFLGLLWGARALSDRITAARSRYRRRTQVERIGVVLVPYTDGTLVGVAYSHEDSGEPVAR